jgi:hypothetical protein
MVKIASKYQLRICTISSINNKRCSFLGTVPIISLICIYLYHEGKYFDKSFREPCDPEKITFQIHKVVASKQR